MANPVIGIDIVASLAGLQAQLAKLGPGMEKEAKAMTAALAKEVRQQVAAMKQVGAAGKQAATGIGQAGSAAQNLRSQIFDLTQQVSAGQNPLTILNQQGFQIAEAFGRGGGAGAMSLLGAAIAPLIPLVATVGTVLGTAFVAWKVYNEESERAAETAAMVRAANEALTPILESTRAATLELAGATGALSEEQVKIEQNALRVQAAVTQATAESVASVRSLHQQMASFSTSFADAAATVVPAWTPLGIVIDGLTDSSEELQGQLDVQTAAIQKAAAAGTANRVVTESLIKAKGDLTAASKKLADAESLLGKRYDEESKRIHSVLDGIAALDAAAEDSADARLEGADAIRAALIDEVEGLEGARDATLALARTDEERAETFEAFYAAKVQATETGEEKIAELVAAGAQTQQAAIEKAAEESAAWVEKAKKDAAEVSSATTSAIGSIYGSVADALALGAEELAKTNKKAAKSMFAASKAAGISQAVVNTALGITAALTIPPPVGPAQAIATAAAGAVQIATIAGEQPSFHAGGYPDEMRARLLTGEPVLNRQAASRMGLDSPGAVAAVNQGGATPGSSTSLRIGRMEAREIARTDIAAGGAIPAAINRAVAKGTRKAGVSGRGPIA